MPPCRLGPWCLPAAALRPAKMEDHRLFLARLVCNIYGNLIFALQVFYRKLLFSLLNDCLVTFVERDIFFKVDENDIVKTFMSLRKRRINQ